MSGDWPRISLVTPSLNQSAFLERTMQSVLSQDYPNLEYLVIDGGSTDGSREIVAKNADRLAYWIGERDSGQADALQKGFRRAAGDVLGWLNSDDRLLPGTLRRVAELYREGREFVSARARFVDENGRLLRMSTNWQRQDTFFELLQFWREDASPPQAALFFSRRLYELAGGIDPSLHYTMDYDLWLRIARHCELLHVDEVWAECTVHPKAKSVADRERFEPEIRRIVAKALADASLGLRLKYLWTQHTSKGYMAQFVPDAIVRCVRRLKGREAKR